MPRLQIYIAHNYRKFDLVKFHSCDSLIYFQGVEIRNSGLQSVGPNAFANLHALQYLRLINGLLAQPPSLRFICKSLILLDLQSNIIAHIDKSYFAGCVKLATLSLQRNLLSSMPDISYVVHTLTTLNLSRNQLSGTYSYFVMFFPRLRAILLEYNHLSAFCMQQIKYLPSLFVISLNNNNITDVRFDDLQHRKERLALTLYNNPLQCDKGWNHACDDSPQYWMKPDLICGDNVQIWGIQCTDSTGIALKFDNPLYPSFILISGGWGWHGRRKFQEDQSMNLIVLWMKMFSFLIL